MGSRSGDRRRGARSSARERPSPPRRAHRWSRAIAFAGRATAGIDGCGALVLTTTDPRFDLGSGPLIPSYGTVSNPCVNSPLPVPNVAVARFQP